MSFSGLSLQRRRAMMGHSEVLPPQPASDGRIWAYYDVNTTESATQLLYTTTGIGTTINIDGVETARVTSHQFDSTGLHLVKFTPTLTYLGRSVFYRVPRLLEIYIPEGITRTDGGNTNTATFNNNTILKKIVLPTTFIKTGVGEFCDLKALEYINLDSLTVVGSYTFNIGSGSANPLKIELNMPNLTGNIERCFIKCGFTKIKNLGSITGLTGGGNSENAPFVRNTNLTEVTLPATLTNVTSWSFANCTNLKDVTCLASTPPTMGTQVFLSCSKLANIYVPAESVDAYKEAAGWSSFASKIQAI